ncbi:MAG: serine protease [Phycisphaeraceae bacterium]
MRAARRDISALRRRVAVTVLIGVCAAGAFALGRWVRGPEVRRDVRESSDGRTYVLPEDQVAIGELRYSENAQGVRAGQAGAHLEKVDRVISDAGVRAAIRRVQPACAAVSAASGVCINASGDVLTNAHVAGSLGQRVIVRFADGGLLITTCRAINHRLDLAVVGARTEHTFAFAPLAAKPAVVSDPVVCIGQPEPHTPAGKPSGFGPFHVSAGTILEVGTDPLGDQSLGSIRHDAWTYWGHSGSPLFDLRGRIVALHNSWDVTHGQRHAVSLAAIEQFLQEAKVTYTVQK